MGPNDLGLRVIIQPGQIAAIRKHLSISQAELANKSGVSQSLIAKIEAGRVDPAFSKVQAISAALEAMQPDKRQRTAIDLMSPNLLALNPSDPVHLALSSMAKLRASQIPVINNGVVEGTLTETSLMDFVVKAGSSPEALRTPVRLLMDDPLPQVGPATQQEELLVLLRTFPAVLVRDRVKIWGIVTKLDILSKSSAFDPSKYKNPEVATTPRF